MWKSICILLILLYGSGNSWRVERDFVVGPVNDAEWCWTAKKCQVHGFTDWFSVGKNCVKYFNWRLNFTQAEFTCRIKAPGAHLASVHSSQENNDLYCIVKKMNPRNLRVWLGGFEFLRSGKFFWLDGSFWNYQNWSPGEPNHMYTSTEECVEMNWKNVSKWNDANCYSRKSFICAFRPSVDMLEAEFK